MVLSCEMVRIGWKPLNLKDVRWSLQLGVVFYSDIQMLKLIRIIDGFRKLSAAS